MSDAQYFEDDFARQLRSYAAAGAPALERRAVARAVAAGVASRRISPRRWHWPVLRSAMLAPAALDQPRRSRIGILALAVILAALLLITAIVLGSGLIRLPSEPRPLLTVADEPLTGCDEVLSTQAVLELALDNSNRRVIIFQDGLVATGPGPAGASESWRQRRLTPDGQRHIAALTEPLVEWQCQTVSLGKRETRGSDSLAALVNGSVVSVTIDDNAMRLAGPDESARLGDMIGQLGDLDRSLPGGSWIDAEWRAYQPDRWRLTVYEHSYGVGGAGPYPTPPDVALPGGATLETFGSYYDPANQDPYRCVALDDAAATTLADELDLVDAPDPEPGLTRYFSRGESEFYVSLRALLPREPDCDPVEEPTPAPSAAPGIEGSGLTSCGGMPTETALRLDIGGPLAPNRLGTTPWLSCFWPRAPHGDLVTFARTRGTSIDEARSYAESLFGEPVDVADGTGTTIFYNACLEPDAACAPAAAVHRDLYLSVIWYPNSPADELRALADGVATILERKANDE